MGNDLLDLFIPFIAIAVNTIFQIFSIRSIPKWGLLKSVFAGFAAGFIVLVGLIFLNTPPKNNNFADLLFFGFVSYVLLGYIYFQFINLGETARRVRILRELEESSSGLTLNELLARYNAGEIVAKRFARLISTGQIQETGNRYFLKGGFVLFLAKSVVFFQRLLFKRYSKNESLDQMIADFVSVQKNGVSNE